MDPWARHLAQPLALPGSAAPAAPPPPGPSGAALELVQLEQLVRSLAWGGSRQRGVARLVLGTGELAGTRVDVQVDGRQVCLDLEGPGGPAETAWRERIVERLEARGLVVHVAR